MFFILNIHRTDGSVFERLPIDLFEGAEVIAAENLAKLFHASLPRDQVFYGVVINQKKPVIMIYSGEDKSVVRVLFCDNHSNYEFRIE